MKKTMKVAVIAVLAFMLTGCMRMHVELTLNEDNTAGGTMIMAMSDEFAESMMMSPEELMAGMNMEDSAPDGSTSEPYKQDGYTGTKYTFADTPLATATSGQEMQIERVGDEFVVSGEMDMSDSGMDGLGDDPSGEAAAEAMLEGMDMAFKVTFPGPVSTHNGTLDGNTVSWQMVPGEVLVFDARGSAIGGKAVAPPATEEPAEEPSEDPAVAPSEEPAAGETDKPAETPAAAPADDDKSNLPLYLGIGGGVLLLLIIAAAIMIANSNKKKKLAEQNAQGNAYAGAPGTYDQNGFQQQGYQQQGYQQPSGYQQPPVDQNGYQQQGYQQPGGYQQPPADQGGYQQQGYQQPGGYQQPPVDQGGYQQPEGQQDIPQPPNPDGWYQQGQAPEQPTQQFPQPPVDPQNPQNPQQ